MTIESLFLKLVEYRLPIVIVMFVAPWLAWLLCILIPGRREEPFLLSLNMAFALICFILWTGYLVYTVNLGGGGWAAVVKKANFLLLIMPPYYIIASIRLSRTRLSLATIPAYRTLEGLAILTAVFLVLSWFSNRVRFLFFSFIPAHYFLGALAILMVIGYFGYRRIAK